MARAIRAAEAHGCQGKREHRPQHSKNNILANIILDLRYVTGYGSR